MTRRHCRQFRWEESEEALLRDLFVSNHTWREIAAALGRSYMSVRHRAYKMGLRRFKDGNSKTSSPAKKTVRNRRYQEKYPEKRAAHKAVWREIDCGRLKRLPCESCGKKRSQAHHADYSRPLDVTWLCAKCHSKEHKSARASARAGFSEV